MMNNFVHFFFFFCKYSIVFKFLTIKSFKYVIVLNSVLLYFNCCKHNAINEMRKNDLY